MVGVCAVSESMRMGRSHLTGRICSRVLGSVEEGEALRSLTRHETRAHICHTVSTPASDQDKGKGQNMCNDDE